MKRDHFSTSRYSTAFEHRHSISAGIRKQARDVRVAIVRQRDGEPATQAKPLNPHELAELKQHGLPKFIQDLSSSNYEDKLRSTVTIRKILFGDVTRNVSLSSRVLEMGILTPLMNNLVEMHHDLPLHHKNRLLFETIWAIAHLAFRDITVLIRVPDVTMHLVHLLSSCSCGCLLEQVCWALGNLSAASEELKHVAVQNAALESACRVFVQMADATDEAYKAGEALQMYDSKETKGVGVIVPVRRRLLRHAMWFISTLVRRNASCARVVLQRLNGSLVKLLKEYFELATWGEEGNNGNSNHNHHPGSLVNDPEFACHALWTLADTACVCPQQVLELGLFREVMIFGLHPHFTVRAAAFALISNMTFFSAQGARVFMMRHVFSILCVALRSVSVESWPCVAWTLALYCHRSEDNARKLIWDTHLALETISNVALNAIAPTEVRLDCAFCLIRALYADSEPILSHMTFPPPPMWDEFLQIMIRLIVVFLETETDSHLVECGLDIMSTCHLSFLRVLEQAGCVVRLERIESLTHVDHPMHQKIVHVMDRLAGMEDTSNNGMMELSSHSPLLFSSSSFFTRGSGSIIADGSSSDDLESHYGATRLERIMFS